MQITQLSKKLLSDSFLTLHSFLIFLENRLYLNLQKLCYSKSKNLIQKQILCQMNNNFNQDIFKTTDKIRNKHKKQTHVESISEQIIKTTGIESILKAFL